MSEKNVKRAKRIFIKASRKIIRKYIGEIQDMPFRTRLYFAWIILSRKNREKL